MSSTVGISNLSEDKRVIVNKFRDQVRDILKPQHDDKFLLRWLKARNFDIFKAENMIRDSFKWRRKLQADDILTNYVMPEIAAKYFPTGVIGFDKDGSIIRVIRIHMDFKGILHCGRIADALKFFCYLHESDRRKMAERNAEHGLNEEQGIFILDFEDFTLRTFSHKEVLNWAIQIIRSYQNNYPEALKVCYIINAPSYFNWVLNIFKPFLDSVTLRKLKIFSVGCYTWKDELLKICDPKILPAFLGGLLVDPDGDPRCKTIVLMGNIIPHSYYMKNSDQTLRKDDPEVNFTVIRERSYFDHKVLIKEPGYKLKWEFQTKECNIRFGVLYKQLESNNAKQADLDELIAVENTECHVFPESGELHCEKSGEYILHFDNTYSWLTSKQLFFKVEICKPDENDSKVA